MSNVLSVALEVVAAVVIGSAVGALQGFFVIWIASNCYPWRRCGRCGQDESWPWRRLASKTHKTEQGEQDHARSTR